MAGRDLSRPLGSTGGAGALMPFDELHSRSMMDPFGQIGQMMQMHRSLMSSMPMFGGMMSPFSGLGGDPFGSLLENPAALGGGQGNFMSMSYSMSSQTGPDGRPIVREARQMSMMDDRGFHESRYEARNPEEDRVGLLRGTPAQSVAVEKSRSAQDGTQHTNTRFRNMQEHDLDRFDQEWTSQTQAAPFWTQSRQMTQALTHNPMSHAGYLTAPAPSVTSPALTAPPAGSSNYPSQPRSNYSTTPQGNYPPLQGRY